MTNAAYTGGRVPFWRKVAFGVGGMCNDFMGNVIMVLTVPIYTVTLGLDAAWIGIALSIPIFWAAVTDPIIGHLSDNTRSRFGRRRPYMFVGAVLGGFLFTWIWRASPMWSQIQLFGYFTVMAILFYTTYSLFIVPYNGLASELTMDFDDRTRVMAFRAFFGSLAGVITPWAYKLCFVKALGATELEGVRVVGIIFGLLIVVTGVVPALFSRENPAAREQPKVNISRAFRDTMANRPFLMLAGMVFFILMGIYLVQPMQLYIGIYYLFDGDKSAAAQLSGLAGTMYALVAIMATPLVAWMGTRVGKIRTLLGAQGLLILSSLLTWFLYRPEHPYVSLVCMALMSPAMACVWILLSSMLADTCDFDELKTGLRREGMYGAMYSLIFKGGVALVLAASGFLVKLAGFDPACETQSPSAILNMRILFAVIPAVFAAGSMFCVWRYPLNEIRMRAIRCELDTRNASRKGDAHAP